MLLLPRATAPLLATVQAPADKSMSHRALLFAALARTPSTIGNLLQGADVQATVRVLRGLGTSISPARSGDGHAAFAASEARSDRAGGRDPLLRAGLIQVVPKPFVAPSEPIYCANAGTLLRLLAGALVATQTSATLTGDASLCQRPMRRLAEALGALGASVTLAAGGRPPLRVQAGVAALTATRVKLPVASAQLASAVMLASLGAQGTLVLSPLAHARDHTARMLAAMGVQWQASAADGGTLTMAAGQALHGTHIEVPGDPSSAAFWLAAAAIVPGSQVSVQGVSLNPTRTGFLRLLRRMGAHVDEAVDSTVAQEPRGSMALRAQPLRGIDVGPAEAADAIDELVLLAAIASFAEGETTVRGARQLRTKESDRIDAIASNLRAMGARIVPFEDGFSVLGPTPLRGAQLDACGDHRIAMALAVAALRANEPCSLIGAEVAGISYPGFFSHWARHFGATSA